MTTTSSATSASTASIVKTLGTGSGLDTAAIVDALVNAQFAAKNAALTKKSDALTAQISGLAKLKSGITGFDTALRTLVQGGTLTTQPTSSDAAVAAVSRTGATDAALSGTLTVNRLAAAQAATTNSAIGSADTFMAGTLNVTTGGTTTGIAVAATDTLAAIAAKISAAGLGLTATIVGDGAGVRMTVKSATGAANAFTIAGVADAGNGTPPAGHDPAELSVGNGATGTTIGTVAADAELVLDGATFQRATNQVTGLIAGVRLDLKGTGTTTLGTQAPSAGITQAVGDFVDAFNQLHGDLAADLAPQGGVLRGDPAASTLLRQLGQLTTTSLAANASGAPHTLGDIGVKTNRDGTLAVDATRLAKALADFPAAVEAMFADGSGAANGGLSAALGAITAHAAVHDTAATQDYSFDGETARLTAAQSDIADAQAKATDAAAQAHDRLTAQFAAMDARVAAYKSTQDFLKQQVDAWNKRD